MEDKIKGAAPVGEKGDLTVHHAENKSQRYRSVGLIEACGGDLCGFCDQVAHSPPFLELDHCRRRIFSVLQSQVIRLLKDDRLSSLNQLSTHIMFYLPSPSFLFV